MADRGAASFYTQAGALLRKNLTYQKRNMRSNILLLSFPVLLCLLLTALQSIVSGTGNNKDLKSQSSNLCPGVNCPILALQEWPPLLKLPAPQYRAVKTSLIPFDDLPDELCKRTMSCPSTILVTANNQSFGNLLAAKMFPTSLTLNSSYDSLDYYVLGIYNLYDGDVFTTVQDQCSSNSTFGVGINSTDELGCVQGLHLWRNSSDLINNELYMGFRNGNSEKKISEIIAAYDFLNSDKSGFNVSIWYNNTESSKYDKGKVKKVPIAINLVSNAYLKFLRGPGTNMLFGFVKDYPKDLIFNFRVDISSLLGQLFYILVILQLFPVVLSSLLYEKQHKLRMMMKMHGLGDGPYWLISYSYFLFISSIYMLCFVLFGSVIGLPFFLLNAYSIQFVFYFVYLNLQISLAFLWAALFSNVRTATVVAYLCIFTTVFFGNIVFTAVLQDQLLPRSWIIGIQAFPFMSLYRGLYEFSQYASDGYAQGQAGMHWENLSDGENGMREVLVIMFVDWVVVMVVALYIDHVNSSGKSWLFFLQKSRNFSLQKQESGVYVQMDRPDVIREKEKVDSLLLESNHRNHAIICNNLKKVYPGKDGNPTKLAVKGLSLAVPQGECFGMLGPNGAGKTSFISMMIGLTKPTSGAAFIQGLDLRTDMGRIHTRMGVCPQHDLLWDTLTGREHLLFYGRLKNLKGSALTQAVEESLKSVNLFLGGNANKLAGKYSGGMKRRLSIAISLIGDPKVVYMDEPSTGLDPASRYNLWNVVMQAKQDRAIILTTHLMEEAEALCDRIGIFVDGSLQCIGNPKELKTRYGGCYVLTLTTSPEHDENVANLVQRLSRNASKVYQLSGTQKFELPKQEVRIADVFKTIEKAKSRMPVYAWGVADTTLEDVFIKVAKQ